MTPGLRHLRHVTAGSFVLGAALAAWLLVAEVRGALLVAAVVVCCAASGLALWWGVSASADTAAAGRWRVAGAGRQLLSAVLAVAGVAGLAGYGGATATGTSLWPAVVLPALPAVAVLTATALPRPPVAAIALALTGVVTAAASDGTGTGRWWDAATAVAATALCIGGLMVQTWVWEVASRADRARFRDAEAAVVAERLRFAAELHDIQGHSLQVIVLKSELAARLAATDTGRAVAEMREVEALARGALRDTREVAHGYRAVSLETEIANAVRVLQAAGIRCRTDLSGMAAVPAAAARLLALVVREATTNVIRHSSARDAEIALTAAGAGIRLQVRNDGPLTGGSGIDAGPGNPADSPGGGPARGGGLAGLADRFGAAGGTLVWHRGPTHFTVGAELPLGALRAPA